MSALSHQREVGGPISTILLKILVICQELQDSI